MSQLPIKIKIMRVACGYWHTLAITTQNSVLSTGHNNHGALGLGDMANRSSFCELSMLQGKLYPLNCSRRVIGKVKGIYAGNSVSFFVDLEGKMYSTGSGKLNGLKEAGDILSPREASSFY